MSTEDLRLTQTVQKGGCAAKVAALELRNILSRVEFPPKISNLMIDGRHFDDAAVIKHSEDFASVHTLDFFTPIVDSPKVFGQIASANALSDVYAMGGDPISALAILAFPLAQLPSEVAVDVLQGASQTLKEAGASLAGGHSIDDDTLKFGLSVYGSVHPSRVWSNTGAKAGDCIVLTKPLGTGTLTAGLKRKEFTESAISDAIQSMTQLNRIKDLLSEEQLMSIHAATDVTGFGLIGHLMQMARASEVSARINFSSIPWLSGAKESLKKGFLTKAHRTNAEYSRSQISVAEILREKNEDALQILFDPQTSGGLCLSIDRRHVDDILKKLRPRFQQVALIGELLPASGQETIRVFE